MRSCTFKTTLQYQHAMDPNKPSSNKRHEKNPTYTMKQNSLSSPPVFSYNLEEADNEDDDNMDKKRRGSSREVVHVSGRIIQPPPQPPPPMLEETNNLNPSTLRLSPIPLCGDANRILLVSEFSVLDDYELCKSDIVDEFVSLFDGYSELAVFDRPPHKRRRLFDDVYHLPGSTTPSSSRRVDVAVADEEDSKPPSSITAGATSWILNANDSSSATAAAAAVSGLPLHTATAAAAISSSNNTSSTITFSSSIAAAETPPPPRPSSRSSSFGSNNNNTRESHSVAREAKWDERYQELLEYRKRNGHCMVPNNFPSHPKLAQWVKRQRYQYKLKMTRKASSLTDDRQRNLESVGFVWDSHEAMWMERWEELRQYREQHGHSNVPASYEANRHLSIWVKCQRRQHKLFRSGQQSNMTLERIAKLDTLDFNYDPTNRTNDTP